MAEEDTVVHEYEPHEESYEGFVRLIVATVLAVLFILVALLSIGFGKSMSVLVGTVGLVIGLASVAVTLMTGGRNWIPSTVLFVLFFLLVATLL